MNNKEARRKLRIVAGPSLLPEVLLDLEPLLFDVTETLEAGGEILQMNLPRRSTSRGRGTRKSAQCPTNAETKTIKIATIASAGTPKQPTSTEQLCLQAANGLLTELNLVRCGIDDNKVPKIIQCLMHKESCVSTLLLTRNHISDEGAVLLATLLDNNQTTLTRLDINQNNIGEIGINAINIALDTNTTLRRFDMSWNGDIEQQTKLDIVRKLILNITAFGVKHHHGNEPFELYLSGLALGCQGICKVLEMLKGNMIIRRINLADNDIREIGATAIYEWLNHGSLVTHLDLDENYDMEDTMKEKIASVLVKNRLLPSLFLERYRIDQGPCLHRSATSVVWAASDMRAPGINGARVALKHTKHRSPVSRELNARVHLASLGITEHVLVKFIGYHVPESMEADHMRLNSNSTHSSPSSSSSSSLLWTPQIERTRPNKQIVLEKKSSDSFETIDAAIDVMDVMDAVDVMDVTPDQFSYVTVMELADRSLYDLCSKQRLAGYDIKWIQNIFQQLVERISCLHKCNIVHGDIKPRNILLQSRHDSDDDPDGAANQAKVVLCDLDCAKIVEELYKNNEKIGSTGYLAPEIVQWKSQTNPNPIAADTNQDVWSLGCVLFELCTGITLFRQDMNNDMIVEEIDNVRMHTWHTISDNELRDVLRTCNHVSPEMNHAAKHLIRWCLKALPNERPNAEQILNHRFICYASNKKKNCNQPISSNELIQLPMKYRFFISHAQVDAASTAKAMYGMLARLGVHCWYDMQQKALTLDGMKNGVEDSAIFLLIMSQVVLTRWFCQQEILTAIKEGKRIQLLIEEDPRFRPFDVNGWVQHDSAVRTFTTDTLEDYSKICLAIDNALSKMIIYRRRDYETDAMLKELCRLSGASLPIDTTTDVVNTSDVNLIESKIVVHVLCRRGGKGDMADILVAALQRTSKNIIVQEDPTQLLSADKVLVLLTENVLNGDKDSCLLDLIKIIETDKQIGGGLDRLIFVCQTEAKGWIFGNQRNPDIASAPKCVQEALNDHEAVTFRSNRYRHEFTAMVEHLQEKIVAKGVVW